MLTEIVCGDNLPILREMPDNSVDAIVTDPPYGLSFMGRKWDYDVPSVELWAECLRVLKPGGHLLAFAGTRTQHRMAVRIEDAGFEIRDMLAWVYGSGFPKSLDVSKAIDKAAGVEREVVGPKVTGDGHIQNRKNGTNKYGTFKMAQDGIDMLTAPATDAAKQWDGWGTALKPALEPITLARKPLAERTIAANVLEWGTGGVNVDGCRVEGEINNATPYKYTGNNGNSLGQASERLRTNGSGARSPLGRFPANFIHDGSDEVVGLFPVTGPSKAGGLSGQDPGMWAGKKQYARGGHDDQGGSAARFFYCAKASRSEREAGLEGLDGKKGTTSSMTTRGERERGEHRSESIESRNHHPTVKPIALMRYLCRLVTPPGGIVLDPFTGSGTTGCAAMLEGFRFIGMEREAEYAEIARRRIEHWRDVASQIETIIEDVQEKLFAEMV